MVSIDHAANVEKFGGAAWITLTFDGWETGAREAKTHLDYLLSKVLPRNGFDGPKIWKAELQKRGTIHFHILAFDPPTEKLKRLVSETWHKRTGSEKAKREAIAAAKQVKGTFFHNSAIHLERKAKKIAAHLKKGTDVATVPDVKRLRCYLAKYLTKETGDSAPWNLGRVWGKYQAKRLILHKPHEVEIRGAMFAHIRNFARAGVHLPKTVYDINEWMEYAGDQVWKKRSERISYWKWRKQKKRDREKALQESQASDKKHASKIIDFRYSGHDEKTEKSISEAGILPEMQRAA